MKKLIFLLSLIIVFIVSTGFTQTITVTNPHGGENWVIGHTYTITWNSSGITGNVGIKLVQNGSDIGYIAQNVPNSSGSYSWTINNLMGIGPIAPGSNYQIRVKKSGVVSGLSAGYFKIITKNNTKSIIKIIAPVKGDLIPPNKDVWIIWKIIGERKYKKVTIVLIRKSEGYGGSIANKIPNNGKFLWRLSNKNIKASANEYQIEIQTADDWDIWKEKDPNIKTKTGTFYIGYMYPTAVRVLTVDQKAVSKMNDNQNLMGNLISKTAGAKIEVLSPKKGDIFYKNKENVIKWKTTGLMNTRVDILLLDSSNSIRFAIASGTANDGKYIWKPSSIYFRNMKIKVRTIGGGISGTSGTFDIRHYINNNCNTHNIGADIECLINKYRKANGLPPIPHSNSLEKVAKAHVKDIALYHPEKNCPEGNEHSWSTHGNWKAGCYNPKDPSTYSIMWLKPKEIASNYYYGYEIFHIGGNGDASDILNSWKNSPNHKAVILNQGVWSGYKWKGMAAAVYGSYAAVWFDN